MIKQSLVDLENMFTLLEEPQEIKVRITHPRANAV